MAELQLHIAISKDTALAQSAAYGMVVGDLLLIQPPSNGKACLAMLCEPDGVLLGGCRIYALHQAACWAPEEGPEVSCGQWHNKQASAQ
jgi:hypothetical protein